VRNQIFSGVSFGKNFDALRAAFVGVIRRWRLMLQPREREQEKLGVFG
jgi:hypothetical protein